MRYHGTLRVVLQWKDKGKVERGEAENQLNNDDNKSRDEKRGRE